MLPYFISRPRPSETRTGKEFSSPAGTKFSLVTSKLNQSSVTGKIRLAFSMQKTCLFQGVQYSFTPQLRPKWKANLGTSRGHTFHGMLITAPLSQTRNYKEHLTPDTPKGYVLDHEGSFDPVCFFTK